MTLEESAVTWSSATPVLTALTNVASVRDVNVVGSVARQYRGNDLDVVLVVDFYTYVAFLKAMWDEECLVDADEKSDYYLGYREQRVQAALAVIQMSPAEYGWVTLAIAGLGADIDIHVMPEGWTEHIDDLQTHLSHKDPQFVRNIAGDAKSVRTVEGKKGQRLVAGLGKKVLALA
jgi:predicted nucleotidyltransferase